MEFLSGYHARRAITLRRRQCIYVNVYVQMHHDLDGYSGERGDQNRADDAVTGSGSSSPDVVAVNDWSRVIFEGARPALSQFESLKGDQRI